MSSDPIQMPIPKLSLPSLDSVALPPVQIARIARLSYKEGQGKLSEAEKIALEDYTQIDLALSPRASELLFNLMHSAYKLGELVARGEA